MWNKLTEVMDTKNNYVEYRNSLLQAKKSNSPTVPFLGKFKCPFLVVNPNIICFPFFFWFHISEGVYLRDLTFIEDGNPDKIGSNINFQKIKLMGSIIQEVQAFQKYRYNFQKKNTILQFLKRALIPIEDPEDTIYELSQVVEPREG